MIALKSLHNTIIEPFVHPVRHQDDHAVIGMCAHYTSDMLTLQHTTPAGFDLNQEALKMAMRAYAPYSNFKVGAAGITDQGNLVTGCNVENVSYGLTLCAECALVCDVFRKGDSRLMQIVAMSDTGRLLQPCGRCLQLLYEIGGSGCVVNDNHTVGELLPAVFDEPVLRNQAIGSS